MFIMFIILLHLSYVEKYCWLGTKKSKQVHEYTYLLTPIFSGCYKNLTKIFLIKEKNLGVHTQKITEAIPNFSAKIL